MSEEPSNPSMMRQAIELAMLGRGSVEPNPMVGCVIVKQDRVIGEGFHEKYGEGHAEPMALASCTESPEGASAYVTLEPCCHVKKQTPPCVPRLIEAKIARVFIGALDPNPEVNGRGVEQLRQAGVEVHTGIMEAECRQLIAPFIATTQYHRPYITLKWAQSADGKIAGPGGIPVRISNEFSQRAVHALRGRCDAIAVGINTVLTDDPLLTVREAKSLRPLHRYVLDRQLRTPVQSRLVQTASQAPLVIATDPGQVNSAHVDELRRRGVEIIAANTLASFTADWHRRKFTHILIEPGPTLAAAFIAANLADRIWIIRSLKKIDHPAAPAAFELPESFLAVGAASLGGDQLTEYLNSGSSLFFSPVESADLRLAQRP